MAERDAVRVAGETIEYEVIRSRRRRRTIEISLDVRTGVRVAVPLRTAREEIQEVVARRAAWIARQRELAPTPPPPREFVTGECLPYLGRQLVLSVEPHPRKRVTAALDGERLRVGVPGGLGPGGLALGSEERRAVIERAVTAWYRRAGGQHIEARVGRWVAAGGRAPARVLIRNQRARWGSCAPDGTLRFNWRIVMAPPTVVDYVVVHELAHLALPNHSPAFWSEVERMMPEYRVQRALLKRIGASLAL